MDTENGGYVARSAGLGVVVGSIQEKVNRLREELTRAEDELIEADSRDKEELTGIDQRQEASLERITREVAALTTRVNALETSTTTKPAPPAPPALPPRQAGERNQDFFPRVEAWAKAVGKSGPPKPTLGEQSTAYDRRIQRWSTGR